MQSSDYIGQGWASLDADEGGAMAVSSFDRLISAPERQRSASYSDYYENLSNSFDEDKLSHPETESRSTTPGVHSLTPTSSNMTPFNSTASYYHHLNATFRGTRVPQFPLSDSHSLNLTEYREPEDSLMPSQYSYQDISGDDASSQAVPDYVPSFEHGLDLISRDDLQPSPFGDSSGSHGDSTTGAGAMFPPTDSTNEHIPVDPLLELPGDGADVFQTEPQLQLTEPWSEYHLVEGASPNNSYHHLHQRDYLSIPARYGSGIIPYLPPVHRSQPNDGTFENNRPPPNISSIQYTPNQSQLPGPSSISSNNDNSNSRKVECPECRKKLRPCSMPKHRLIHQPKQFKCLPCDKEFTTNKDYSRHVKAVHLRERNYKCDTCGRSFNRRENLRRHQSNLHSSDADVQEDDGS